MIYLTRTAAPPLSRHVDALWYVDEYAVPHRHERTLPNGRFQIIFDLTDGFARAWGPESERIQRAMPPIVVGLHSAYGVLETAALRSIMGVVLRPGGSHGLLDVPADAFRDKVVPLDAIWGRAAYDLRDRLRETTGGEARLTVLEQALRQRMCETSELHAAVRFGLATFIDRPHIQRVIDTARFAGISRRRFAQVFREQVGMTPKLYCRVHRFQQVVTQIFAGGPVDWAEVALAGGYSDQAHLAHEFRDFSGISPTTYMSSDRPFQNHVVMD